MNAISERVTRLQQQLLDLNKEAKARVKKQGDDPAMLLDLRAMTDRAGQLQSELDAAQNVADSAAILAQNAEAMLTGWERAIEARRDRHNEYIQHLTAAMYTAWAARRAQTEHEEIYIRLTGTMDKLRPLDQEAHQALRSKLERLSTLDDQAEQAMQVARKPLGGVRSHEYMNILRPLEKWFRAYTENADDEAPPLPPLKPSALTKLGDVMRSIVQPDEPTDDADE